MPFSKTESFQKGSSGQPIHLWWSRIGAVCCRDLAKYKSVLLASEVELGTYQVQGLESRPLVIRLLEFELDILKDGESLVTLGTRPTFLLRDGVWAILVYSFLDTLLPCSQRECQYLSAARRRRTRGTRRGTRRISRSDQ